MWHFNEPYVLSRKRSSVFKESLSVRINSRQWLDVADINKVKVKVINRYTWRSTSNYLEKQIILLSNSNLIAKLW